MRRPRPRRHEPNLFDVLSSPPFQDIRLGVQNSKSLKIETPIPSAVSS